MCNGLEIIDLTKKYPNFERIPTFRTVSNALLGFVELTTIGLPLNPFCFDNVARWSLNYCSTWNVVQFAAVRMHSLKPLPYAHSVGLYSTFARGDCKWTPYIWYALSLWWMTSIFTITK